MGELVSYLNSNCKSQWSGRIWLDVEGSQYWLGSASSNQAWYKQLVDSCSTYGVKCGLYSSQSQWVAIFGSASFSYNTALPMWYAHYDNSASFSDYSSLSFGGYSSPHAKQYAGDTTLCSFGKISNRLLVLISYVGHLYSIDAIMLCYSFVKMAIVGVDKNYSPSF